MAPFLGTHACVIPGGYVFSFIGVILASEAARPGCGSLAGRGGIMESGNGTRVFLSVLNVGYDSTLQRSAPVRGGRSCLSTTVNATACTSCGGGGVSVCCLYFLCFSFSSVHPFATQSTSMCVGGFAHFTRLVFFFPCFFFDTSWLGFCWDFGFAGAILPLLMDTFPDVQIVCHPSCLSDGSNGMPMVLTVYW